MTGKKPTPGMPRDGRKGAPDGVNSQGEEAGTGAAKSRALHEGRAKDAGDEDAGGGWLDHGGQSVMGYHGPQQLGDKVVKRGGNPNAGSETD